MLARLARELPADGYRYEPKWDGFRCLAFRDGAEVDLRSRHERPFSRYFPEIDLLDRPFDERRGRLEALLAAATPPLFVTPMTDDRGVAQEWLARYQGGGVDGVVAKHRDLAYQPGVRAIVKVKREQTADCVVAGFRPTLDGGRAVASLLVGLYDEDRLLQHIGVVSAFPRAQRAEIYEALAPLAVPLSEHPWRDGWLVAGGALGRLKGSAGRWTPDMEHDWMPVAPVRVIEVAYDQVDGHRLRHPARFRRWRPDREAASCSIDQLDVPTEPIHELLPL